MPRKNVKGKWNLKMTPDEWYKVPDPFDVFFNELEDNKCSLICSLIDYNGVGIDVGCGEGIFTERYSCIKPFVGFDVSNLAIGRAKGRKHKPCYYVNDITNLRDWKFRANTVILSEVLYYIKPELWETVANNIYKMINGRGQFIISCGQYFTEEDIRKIFSKIDFDRVFKLPSKKYEYNLIMSGNYVPNKKMD